MAIPFQCPGCGRTGNADDSFAGKKAKCRCGALIDFTARSSDPEVRRGELEEGDVVDNRTPLTRRTQNRKVAVERRSGFDRREVTKSNCPECNARPKFADGMLHCPQCGHTWKPQWGAKESNKPLVIAAVAAGAILLFGVIGLLFLSGESAAEREQRERARAAREAERKREDEERKERHEKLEALRRKWVAVEKEVIGLNDNPRAWPEVLKKLKDLHAEVKGTALEEMAGKAVKHVEQNAEAAARRMETQMIMELRTIIQRGEFGRALAQIEEQVKNPQNTPEHVEALGGLKNQLFALAKRRYDEIIEDATKLTADGNSAEAIKALEQVKGWGLPEYAAKAESDAKALSGKK